MDTVLTLPDASEPLSIRAKALVFHDPGSQALLAQVERIARSEATALIIGETGTGKELIARHIHAISTRSGPFVPVNCGAFSETLIDAELFGHETGAFTGASQARSGWFEAANVGTLFLDEIGDLPLPLQVKLLRVLQERQVVRLGSRRPIPLDVRLVAATNIDLARAVEAQHFRADLYYRLSVATVSLPPLRERRDDILPLARHFVGVYRSRLGLPEVVIGTEAQQALLDYSWPGNIRELENVIHFALIVCRDHVVRIEDLKLVPLSPRQAPEAAAVAGPAAFNPLPRGGLGAALAAAAGTNANARPVDAQDRLAVDLPLDRLVKAWGELLAEGRQDLFDAVEFALVHTAYRLCAQNQVRTARAMGITRNMLRTLLKRHGLLPGGAEDPDHGGDEAEGGAAYHAP
ncbi:MAG: sigma-54 interaction domain-containing protein [Pseudomonadota bacterium]